jgi:hypothetical protein
MPKATQPRRGARRWDVALVGAIALAAIGLAVSALVDEDTAAPEVGASVAEIAADAGRYVGRAVSVSGEIERVVDPHGFVLGKSGLLVVRRDAAVDFTGRTLEKSGDVVQVTGRVQTFSASGVENELGLDAALYAEFEREPVVVAERVQLISSRESEAVPAPPPRS